MRSNGPKRLPQAGATVWFGKARNQLTVIHLCWSHTPRPRTGPA